MTMNKPFNSIELKNDVVIDFFDQSNRYYGDFHRVKINVVAKIPIVIDALPKDLHKFAATCPVCVEYKRSLEQMGVTSRDVETVKESLVAHFLESVADYLNKKNFAEGLLRKLQAEKRKKSYSIS